MVIHLESGTCPYGIGRKGIKTLAFECSQSRQYTTRQDADQLFRCPGCAATFLLVSAMFQHIESSACGAAVEGPIADLHRHLANQVGLRNVSSDNVWVGASDSGSNSFSDSKESSLDKASDSLSDSEWEACA
nr:hypothetical protein CFP56_20520 [Quercus suber]